MQPTQSKMRTHLLFSLCILLVMGLLAACVGVQPAATETESGEPVPLRLAVALTPQELVTFQSALDGIRAAHPEWEIALEEIPQDSALEKINTMLAANT